MARENEGLGLEPEAIKDLTSSNDSGESDGIYVSTWTILGKRYSWKHEFGDIARYGGMTIEALLVMIGAPMWLVNIGAYGLYFLGIKKEISSLSLAEFEEQEAGKSKPRTVV